ncbi:MAG: hypothetical protein IT357_13030 [Gemmatimonadaceae bacterium]|nr:hypothetical protein [Gemmatimonadaceae bacterium]
MRRDVRGDLAAGAGARGADRGRYRGADLPTRHRHAARRSDGATQVTYGGQPLYNYLGDAAPGQTRGLRDGDSWSEWYLVTPAGRAVEASRDGTGTGRRRGRRR